MGSIWNNIVYVVIVQLIIPLNFYSEYLGISAVGGIAGATFGKLILK
jgi:hypothetical protein